MKIDRAETVEGRELVKIAVAYAEKHGSMTVELPVSALRELLDASLAEVEAVTREMREFSADHYGDPPVPGPRSRAPLAAWADRLDAREGER